MYVGVLDWEGARVRVRHRSSQHRWHGQHRQVLASCPSTPCTHAPHTQTNTPPTWHSGTCPPPTARSAPAGMGGGRQGGWQVSIRSAPLQPAAALHSAPWPCLEPVVKLGADHDGALVVGVHFLMHFEWGQQGISNAEGCEKQRASVHTGDSHAGMQRCRPATGATSVWPGLPNASCFKRPPG